MAALTHAPAKTGREADTLEERIRVRAHEIYLRRGGKEGTPDQDWLQAELEIHREQAQGK
jgi:hypothetical protein